MTSEQASLVRWSWSDAARRADQFTATFYAHLFDVDESAARLFAGVDMAAQRVKLAQALAVVVHTLDDPDRLLPALAALGKRHAGYGVEDHHFDSVGEALVAALHDTLGSAFTADVHAAWSELYAVAAAVMRRALARARIDGAIH